MRWKLPLFALVTVVLFFGVVEALLWAAGVHSLLEERDPFQGFSESMQVFELDAERGVWRTRRRATLHSFAYQEFAEHKPVNGFRYFVMGGSTAVGFPWSVDVSFGNVLSEGLRTSWPDREIEGVNAAAMSYGSLRLRVLAPELLRHQPDALVIYTGHNEFVERRFYHDRLEGVGELDRARALLYRSRLVSSLQRAWEAATARSSAAGDVDQRSVGQLLGLDVAREYTTEVDAGEWAVALERFEDNIRTILTAARSAAVPVVLCTVPSNLRDWRPNQSFFASAVAAGDRKKVAELIEAATAALDLEDATAALSELQRARSLAPGYAETHFLLGRAYALSVRQDAALEAYRLARDLDGKPARATSAINDLLRRLAREEGAMLVEAETEIEAAAPHSIPGFELFEDYVHLKPGTHKRVAYLLWRAFQRPELAGERRPAEPDRFWQTVGPPADEGSEPLAATGAQTPQMLYNLAIVLENQGAFDEAIDKYTRCLELQPSYYTAANNLARLQAKLGRDAEAIAAYRHVIALKPSFARAWIGLGEALQRVGQLQLAEEALRRATTEDPLSAHAWASLGSVLVASNRQEEAEQAYHKAIELDPEHLPNRVNLGLTLLFRQKLDQADAIFSECLELAPENTAARNGLAAVLTERGNYDEAERIFLENLRLDPDDEFAAGGLELIRRRRAEKPF